MKPTKRKPSPKIKDTPEPWQTGDYDRRLKIEMLLPYSILLLCKLWQVKPADIITDFLHNLAHASWKREGRDAAKQKLVEYILLSPYGKEYYSENDLTQMFKELDAMGLLFPNNGTGQALDSYVAFRQHFYHHWFNHWYHKTRRRTLKLHLTQTFHPPPLRRHSLSRLQRDHQLKKEMPERFPNRTFSENCIQEQGTSKNYKAVMT